MPNIIDTIEIINFQSHKHTTMEFVPGVNIIKGTSHSGKSSIIRALRWLYFNRSPGVGDGFKSHFASDKDSVEVGCSFTEGEWIAREKGKENKYLTDGLELKALRKDVPDEVKAITQITDINFQSQNDGYFLIGDTPGIAGRKLNEIVGLQIIDEVRTKINQKVNTTEQKLNITMEDLEKTEEGLKKYKHVKHAERLVNRIELLQAKRFEKENRKHTILYCIDSIKIARGDITLIKRRLKIEPELLKAQEQLKILKEKENKQNLLSSLIKNITYYSTLVKKLEEKIKIESRIKKVKEQYQNVKEIHQRMVRLIAIVDKVAHLSAKIKNITRNLTIKNKNKKELEKQLDFCPSCGAEKKHWRNK